MGKQRVCRLVALNCRYTHSCLALFYLREALEKNLPETAVEILQLTINEPYYQTLLRVVEDDPEVLLFSAYIWNSGYLSRLLVDLARLRPGRPMVIGGPQAEFLGELPSECTLVRGEIEGVDPAFYQDLAGESLQLFYTCRIGIEFPFPYRKQDFDSHLQNRQILYESSRGCPFSCSYCLSAVHTRVVHKKLDMVENELAQILAAGPTLIKFVDRTFNDNPDRALAIWRYLVSCKVQTRFHFEVAPDRFTPEMLDFLATVPTGLFQFEIGIQSTHPETLAAVHRHMEVERALATIRHLAQPGNIHLHVDLILGLPEDGLKSFAESFCRVFSCRPDYIQMGLLKVLPGTPIAGNVEKYGLLHCDRPPFEILSTNTMAAQEVAELYLFGECVERFYNNRYFFSLYTYLHDQKEDPFAFFMGLLIVCVNRGFFQLAATQKLMTELLVEYIKNRDDAFLLMELLCYDWLRCGHRFLPDCLPHTPIVELRTLLRRTMPQALAPLYTSNERNRFFKHGIFFCFSSAALEVVDLKTNEPAGVVCFSAEKDAGLHGWSRAFLLTKNGEEFP